MARWSLHPTAHAHAHIVLIPTAFGVDAQAPTTILNAGADLCGYEPLLGVNVDQLAIGQVSTIIDEPPYSMCEAVVAQHLQRGQWPILLPSAMAASWGAIRAIWKRSPDLTLIHCSAHASLLPSPNQIQPDEDPGYSSAAWIERVYQYQIPVIHVGLRSATAQGFEWLRQHRSPVFWSQRQWDPSAIVASLPANPVFLVIDVSVLDPGMISSVPYPEPGGLTWAILLETCLAIFKARPVLGISLGGLSVTSGTQQDARSISRLLNWLLACYGSLSPAALN